MDQYNENFTRLKRKTIKKRKIYMSNTETKTIYRQLGISEDVWIYGQKIEEGLKLVINAQNYHIALGVNGQQGV